MTWTYKPYWGRTLKALLIAAHFADSFAATAIVPSASASLTISWKAPTTNTDGTAITGTPTYNLYQGPRSGPYVKVASALTGTSTVISSLAAGNCFWLSDVETLAPGNTVESLPAGPYCTVQPNAPGGIALSITVTIQ